MERVNDILSRFSPISLSRIGDAKLMDRRDTKFVFREELLPGVLSNLSDHYWVLEINGLRALQYETIYYDTPDFFHFHQHHSKHLNRYKVRIRRYLETNHAFLEVKHKNNHSRTVKKRIALEDGQEFINERSAGFLETHASLTCRSLEPKFSAHFFRITLVNKSVPERVTIDFGLHYSLNSNKYSYERLIIAEVKRDLRIRSPFIRIMRNYKIRSFSISKYCLGVITVHNHVRHNNFKPKIRYINKFIYATDTHP